MNALLSGPDRISSLFAISAHNLVTKICQGINWEQSEYKHKTKKLLLKVYNANPVRTICVSHKIYHYINIYLYTFAYINRLNNVPAQISCGPIYCNSDFLILPHNQT